MFSIVSVVSLKGLIILNALLGVVMDMLMQVVKRGSCIESM